MNHALTPSARSFWVRLLVAQAKGTAPERLVSLKSPPGLTHVQGLFGRQYMTRGAMVSVVEEDASPLLRAGFSRA